MQPTHHKHGTGPNRGCMTFPSFWLFPCLLRNSNPSHLHWLCVVCPAEAEDPHILSTAVVLRLLPVKALSVCGYAGTFVTVLSPCSTVTVFVLIFLTFTTRLTRSLISALSSLLKSKFNFGSGDLRRKRSSSTCTFARKSTF